MSTRKRRVQLPNPVISKAVTFKAKEIRSEAVHYTIHSNADKSSEKGVIW